MSQLSTLKVTKGVSVRMMGRRGSVFLHAELKNPLDYVKVTLKGIDPAVVGLPVEQGFSRRDLDWIVPVRPLTYRRRYLYARNFWSYAPLIASDAYSTSAQARTGYHNGAY